MNKELIKIALFGAVVVVGYQFLLYCGGVEWMLTFPLSMLHYVIIIIVMTLTVLRKKNQVGGSIVLKQSFMVAFISGLIMSASSTLYNTTLFISDPEIKIEMIDKHKDALIKILQERGVEEENIENIIAEKDFQEEQSSNIAKMFFIFVWDTIIVAVIAVILGMAIKPSPVKNEFE